MKIALFVITIVFATLSLSFAEYRNGYFRKDGTYVYPHYRSRQNKSTFDNYSTRGNTNPYTGKKGYKDPFAPKRTRQPRGY